MDKLTLTDTIKALTAMERTLECAVCLGTLKPPLVMCTNNHCVCSSCGEDLKECPTCRTEMASNVRYPIAFNNILNEIPRKCDFSEHCKQFMLGPELKEHRKICPYRLIACKIVSCSWEGPFQSLLEHVKTEHQESVVENKVSSVTFSDFSVNEAYYCVKLVFYKDFLFWMYTKNDPTKGKYKAIVIHIPQGVQAFKCEIKFSSEFINFTYMFKVLSEDVDIDESFPIGKILSISSDELSPFLDDNKQLSYRINIIDITPKIKPKTEHPENENTNILLNMLQRIENKTLCQFCKNTFLPPLRLCHNYHIYCKNCEATTCSLCNNSDLVSYLDIKQKCRHSNECEEVLEKVALEKHERICKYRTVHCRLDCSEKVQLINLCDHIKTTHSTWPIFNENIGFDINTDMNHIEFVNGTDSLYWFVTKHDVKKSKLFLFFISLPLVDNLSMYSTIFFPNSCSNDEHTYTQPVFDENTNINDVLAKGNCMAIASKDLSPYINSDEGGLECSYTIFDKNKQ
uniref:RING-type domain-containing protein n=1 Tax=Clastoptera arizonana TaxID=38151 RepID=A0A1B6CW82_9HEMI